MPGADRHAVLLPRDGGHLEITVEGPENGAPLVMLPSSLRDAGDFDDCAGLLAAAGFRVLRPWPRGMGRSTATTEGLTLSTLADDAMAVVAALGHGRPAILVGHAFGHFVARVADLEHPSKVCGVVIAAAAARVFPMGMSETLAVASDPTRPEAERLHQLRQGFFAEGNDPRPWLEGWHPHLRAAYRAAGAVPGKSSWWPVTNSPILDLQASEDPWRPPETRLELRDALGERVTVREIDHASHALPVEQPRKVAAAIIEWAIALP